MLEAEAGREPLVRTQVFTPAPFICIFTLWPNISSLPEPGPKKACFQVSPELGQLCWVSPLMAVSHAGLSPALQLLPSWVAQRLALSCRLDQLLPQRANSSHTSAVRSSLFAPGGSGSGPWPCRHALKLSAQCRATSSSLRLCRATELCRLQGGVQLRQRDAAAQTDPPLLSKA